MIATATIQMPAYAEDAFGDARYTVWYGGRGGGKSYAAADALLIQAHQQPLRVLCTREHQVSIKDSVHRLLSDRIEVLGLADAFTITDVEIRHRNGSLFLFKGLRHNVANIKSMEGIDRCWCEEAERISEESWAVLIPTVRKSGSRFLITFNPDMEDDPTYKRFVLQPPAGAIVRKVNWQDNAWFPDELRREMEHDYRVDPDAAAHIWGGECRSISDAQVLAHKWTVQEFEPGEDWDGPYHGADWGFAQDPTVLLRGWIHDGCLWVEHEAYRVGLELDHTAEFFKNNVPECEKYVIRGDNSRPETISYLARHGLPRVTAAAKWSGSVEDGIAHLRSYNKIIIHPRCKHTAQEARLYSYKIDKRTSDILPQVVDAHNHCIDALRYMTVEMCKQRQKFEFAVF